MPPPRWLVALAIGLFAVSLTLSWASNKGDAGPGVPVAPTGDIGAGPRLVPVGDLAPAPRAVVAGRHGVNAYRGAGAWVDQYDADVLDDPYPALAEMKARGVRTVYVETGSWRLPRGLDFRDQQGAELAIDQGHALGMKVVAWYLPGLDDVRLDMRHTRAALNLRTERGGRFDGFAADIESQRVGPVALRNAALMRYSRRLRRAAGSDYALGAIVPDQRSTTLSPGLWPGLPYAALAGLYDVFLPMAYSSYRGHGAAFAYGYTRANVEFLRAATRRPVHLIGGIDPNLLPAEPGAVVRGARDGGAIGVSFYDFAGAQDATWRALRLVPAG
jgi:hypothetical protein